MDANQRIYAPDLAKLLGKSDDTARRMLVDIETEHGTAVVRRDGRERYTTVAELKRVTSLPFAEEPRIDLGKLVGTIRRLLADNVTLAARLNELEERVMDLGVRAAR